MKKKLISLVLTVATLLTMMSSFAIYAAAGAKIGDVNSDGSINSKDSLVLKQSIAGWNVTIDLVAADCNGDGNINSKDSLLLKQYNAGWNVTLASQTTTSSTTNAITQTQPTTANIGEWKTMYDWENEALNSVPTMAIAVNGTDSLSVCSLVNGVSPYYGLSNTKITSSKKALGFYSKSSSINPESSSVPDMIKMDITMMPLATNLRICMHIKEDFYQVQNFYIGVKIGTKKYYYRITPENYSEFGYFYLVGKTMTYSADSSITYTITKENLKDVKYLCAWVQTSGSATLLIDDIQYYNGSAGYDSTAEDAALPQPKPIVNDGIKRYIALSFDDGPTITNMNALLDVLEATDTPATFFLIGNKVTAESETVLKRAVSLNCELGNHTYSHANLTIMTADEIKEQVNSANNLIEQYAGVTPVLLRPPFLWTNSTMFEAANMICIGGYCPNDYNGTSLDYKFEYIKTFCGDGSVILLHDTVASNPKLIAKLIPYYKSLGYEFVTISDMFKIKGVTPTTDYMYNDIG